MSTTNRRPNLLFVFADQMRGMDMGCAGNAHVQTPNLDRLAAEGALFPRAFANAPVCTPSRACMLTGRYPLATSVIANDLPLPPEQRGIGHILREAGYRTGYVGKWHLDGVPRNGFTPPGPRRHGFDHWAAANCTHDYYGGYVYRDSPEPIRIESYEPVGHTDFALEFLREDAPSPWALFVSYGTPHDPYWMVPAAYRDRYDPSSLPVRSNVRPASVPVRPLGPRDAEATPAELLAWYYAAITALDEQVGRLLDHLDRSGQRSDTVVVFTSDHGDMLYSHGRLKKQQPYDEAISVPLLWRWPGTIPAGYHSDALFSTVDYVPTLRSLLGLPDETPMDGADRSAQVIGQAPSTGDEEVLLTDLVACDEAVAMGLREWRGLRTRRHTYARWVDGSDWLLFDNETDPFQEHNLVADPSFEEVRRSLGARLDARLRQAGDPVLPGLELVRRQGLASLWNARELELHPAGGARLIQDI